MSDADWLAGDPIAEALSRCAALPVVVVHGLFARYGRPLAEAAHLDPFVTLSDDVTRVGRLQYRAPVDVIANDHFVMIGPDGICVAMPGPLFAAAIAALTKAHSG